MKSTFKHLLGIEDLTKEEILEILDIAREMKEISSRKIKKVPTLRGVMVVLFFIEASTRTRTSFEIAAKRLSADTLSFTASQSSLLKGETLIDTARNLQAMNPDILIIRHAASGAPHLLSKVMDASIINAGDGSHEHPTQALLDLMTIREKKGTVEGLTVSIIGDIKHSRVARSNILCLNKVGSNVKIFGPATMIPPHPEIMNVHICHSAEEAIENSDVIMMLRVQKERQDTALFPSAREYHRFFGLNTENIRIAKHDVIIMHPGPINRGVEISPEIADGKYSVILDQVANGVAVRMAVLYKISTHFIGGDE
jgi:aspartate carbamoyltransferase catalytic subunit